MAQVHWVDVRWRCLHCKRVSGTRVRAVVLTLQKPRLFCCKVCRCVRLLARGESECSACVGIQECTYMQRSLLRCANKALNHQLRRLFTHFGTHRPHDLQMTDQSALVKAGWLRKGSLMSRVKDKFERRHFILTAEKLMFFDNPDLVRANNRTMTTLL